MKTILTNESELVTAPEQQAGANTGSPLTERLMSNFTKKFNSITVAFNTNGAQSTDTYANITGRELWDKLKTPRIGDKNGAHFLRTSLKHNADGRCLSRGDDHCTEEVWLIIIDVDEATAPPQAVYSAPICLDSWPS